MLLDFTTFCDQHHDNCAYEEYIMTRDNIFILFCVCFLSPYIFESFPMSWMSCSVLSSVRKFSSMKSNEKGEQKIKLDFFPSSIHSHNITLYHLSLIAYSLWYFHSQIKSHFFYCFHRHQHRHYLCVIYLEEHLITDHHATNEMHNWTASTHF